MSLVCLHIGAPKTGSSAIQAFLQSHIGELGERGVHYAFDAETAAGMSGNGRALLKYLDARRRRAGIPAELFEDRLPGLYFSDRHRISLVSSELLSTVKKHDLSRFRDRVLGERPLMVIVVVRNIYDHALSMWNQHVKWHAYPRSFEDFALHDYRNDQAKAVANWAACFGPSSLRLVNYDAHAKNIIRPFLELLDVEAPAGWRAPRANRSLTLAELSVQRALNRLHADVPLAKESAALFVSRRPQAKATRMFHPKIARRLFERFRPEIEQLEARMGQDLGWMLTPQDVRRSWVSPFDYARAAYDALPVFKKAVKLRYPALDPAKPALAQDA